MAESARQFGAPSSAIVTEPRSSSTREHPSAALAISGVTSDSPIAVVTSAWHMPRAIREFCRYFGNVRAEPVIEVMRPANWGDLVPDAEALDANTTLLKEYAGLMWYAITAQHRPRRC